MKSAVRAIIIHNNNLLVMRRDKFGKRYYTLIGGHVEMGESTEKALLRKFMKKPGCMSATHAYCSSSIHRNPTEISTFTFAITCRAFQCYMKIRTSILSTVAAKIFTPRCGYLFLNCLSYHSAPQIYRSAFWPALRMAFPNKSKSLTLSSSISTSLFVVINV